VCEPLAGIRLETLVDGIAGFGPVTTSLVLRSYPPKPITP
jgi:Lrp/AsnC family transcriptional regulator, leucine-responsive regulatory protein